jgi:hypothetical protein
MHLLLLQKNLVLMNLNLLISLVLHEGFNDIHLSNFDPVLRHLGVSFRRHCNSKKREINSKGFGPSKGMKAVFVGVFLVLLGFFGLGIVLYQLSKLI